MATRVIKIPDKLYWFWRLRYFRQTVDEIFRYNVCRFVAWGKGGLWRLSFVSQPGHITRKTVDSKSEYQTLIAPAFILTDYFVDFMEFYYYFFFPIAIGKPKLDDWRKINQWCNVLEPRIFYTVNQKKNLRIII